MWRQPADGSNRSTADCREHGKRQYRSSTADDTYRAKAPVFKAILEGQVDPMEASKLGVELDGVVEVGGRLGKNLIPRIP